jgi:hypothetical protein
MCRDTVPAIKEVHHGTEGIEVVEPTGPVLAQAGSTMAAIRHHAGSVLPGTQALDRRVSLVAS